MDFDRERVSREDIHLRDPQHYFALRENVDKVFILSSESQNISEFAGLESLPRAEAAAFLGALPGILSANRVVVTEGHEKSFDAIFYRWILGDSRLEIYPAGGCTDVVDVVSKSGLWKRISTHVTLRGAIDSDYRDPTYLSSITSAGITILPLHEAESYLCLPEVLVAVAEKIGSQESPLTHDQVRSAITAALKSQRLVVAARRVFARARISLAVSLERKVLTAASTREGLISELRTASVSELAKATSLIGPDQIEAAVDTELAAIDAAVQSTDPMEALRLLPAKEVLNALAPRAGCKNGTDLMRSLKKNFKPTDFPHVARLKQSLEAQ